MKFQPDINITGQDGVSLVAEAKVSLPNLERTEEQLRHYMFGMQCPTGVLITPQRMWVYRDMYSSPPKIERVGEFDMSSVWQRPPPTDAASFEIFVQQWLESLALRPTKHLSTNVSEALREYIVPAVASGGVRAAHPRYS